MSESRVQVVVPPVEITEATLPEFEAALLGLLDTGVDGIVIDLGEVLFISSAGLGILVKVGMRLGRRGGCLALAGARRATQHTLELLGLDRMMPLFGTVVEARAHVLSRATAG